MTPAKNQLYYGDNYEVLQRYIKDESVDLVYLDPPFNSRQDYNVLFAEKDGSHLTAYLALLATRPVELRRVLARTDLIRRELNRKHFQR